MKKKDNRKEEIVKTEESKKYKGFEEVKNINRWKDITGNRKKYSNEKKAEYKDGYIKILKNCMKGKDKRKCEEKSNKYEQLYGCNKTVKRTPLGNTMKITK